MQEAAATARRMWTLFEPVHAISYFTEEAKGAFEQGGLRGFWRGYFAGRAAPVGPVGAAPVVGLFFSFKPDMVARALPGIWDLITPAAALQVRQAGAVAALRRLLDLPAGVAVPADVTTAAELLGGVAGDLDVAGRALGASNAALPVPDEPLARLWHAATVLREHRGDGHVAALVAADIDGAEALALRAGTDLAEAGARSRESGAWTRAQLQPVRGWTDGEWDAASGRLARRGLLSADGTATPAGVHLHQAIEGATDAAAARPWARVPDRQAAELERLLVPVARACATALPYPNPIGVPMPAAS